jgi:hypothetical protein
MRKICRAKKPDQKEAAQEAALRRSTMTPRVYEAILKQRTAFIDKFGREPGEDDPVFFDPDKDVPTPIDPDRFNVDLEKALRESGLDPEKAEPSESCCAEVSAWTAYPRRSGWLAVTG